MNYELLAFYAEQIIESVDTNNDSYDCDESVEDFVTAEMFNLNEDFEEGVTTDMFNLND